MGQARPLSSPRTRYWTVKVVAPSRLRLACFLEVSSLRRNIFLRQDVLPVGERKSIFAVSSPAWWSAGNSRKEKYEDVAKSRHRSPRCGSNRRDRLLQHQPGK